MTRKKTLERGKISVNTEATPLAIWPIENFLLNLDGTRAPTAIHYPSGLKFHPSEKANAIAEYMEKSIHNHYLCDENHDHRVENRVQALFEAVDNKPPERIRPCCFLKLIP
jgi:hypothetical protein